MIQKSTSLTYEPSLELLRITLPSCEYDPLATQGMCPEAGPLGPLGFDFAQHRQTLRPSVDGIRSKALRPFGLQ